MSINDPSQLNSDAAHGGENVADSAATVRHEDVPARLSPSSPGPMSARDDHGLTALQRQRESLAQQARAGDRAALRRYLQLRRR